MKFSVKEIAAAAAAFTCSLILCCIVLCSGAITGKEQEDISDKNTEEVEAAAESTDGRPVIVIDPGHGGMDGGASSQEGTLEKDINLQIAVKLSLRTDDSVSIRNQKRQDLLKRKEIIDQAQGTLAVSIHLNSFPEDSSVYGAQVFYPKEEVKSTDGRTDEQSSQIYAESIQKSIEMNISDGRERSVMTKDDFLVFEEPTCPMVLVECGFLSNKDECDRLKTPEYQEEMASAIWEGINDVLRLEKQQKLEIIDSANKGQKK